VKSTMTETVPSSGCGGTAAAMAQNEQWPSVCLCMSVSVCLSVCVTSQSSVEVDGWIELVFDMAPFDLSFCVH